ERSVHERSSSAVEAGRSRCRGKGGRMLQPTACKDNAQLPRSAVMEGIRSSNSGLEREPGAPPRAGYLGGEGKRGTAKARRHPPSCSAVKNEQAERGGVRTLRS